MRNTVYHHTNSLASQVLEEVKSFKIRSRKKTPQGCGHFIDSNNIRITLVISPFDIVVPKTYGFEGRTLR